MIGAAPAAQASPASVSDDTAGVRGVVYASMQHGNRIYIGGEFDFAGRWSGSSQIVDTTGGRVAFPALRSVGDINVAIPDGVGGWFVGGSFTQVLGSNRFGLARITKAGKLTAFRADVTGSVNALALSGGTLYVGGDFSSVGGTSRSNLAAVNASTGTVTSWAPASNGTVRALEVSGSSLFVGGAFSQAGGANRNGLAQLDLVNGTATAFNPGVSGEVRALDASGGTLFVGGDFGSAAGAARTDLAAIDIATATATAWAPSTDGAVNDLTVAGGLVVVGGSFTSASGQPRANLAGFGTDGSLAAWQADTNGPVLDLEPTPSGDLQAVGSFTTVDGLPRLNGAAVNAAGDVTAWDPGTDATIRAVAVSTAKNAAGVVVSNSLLGGSFEYVNGVANDNIAALDVATGDVVRTFVADTDAVVKALALASDGSRLFVGGGFQNVNGAFRSRLAALDPATGALQKWSSNATGSVNTLAVHGDHLYLGGGFGAVSGNQAMNRLARVSVASSDVDPTFDPNPGGTVRALEVTSDGSRIFAVGPFTSFAGQSRPGAALVDANGVLDPWAPSTGGSAIAADLSPDQTRIYFSTSNNRTFAYDYLTPGANTPTWITRTGGDVQAIAATDDEVYVGGHFRNFPEEKRSRNHLASLHASSGLTTDWGPGANGDFGVWTITATADSLLIGGDFDRSGGRRQPGFARFAGTP
jgi:hypothetical protein